MTPTAKSHALACPPPPYAHPPVLRPERLFAVGSNVQIKAIQSAIALSGQGETPPLERGPLPRNLPARSAVIWCSDDVPPWAVSIEQAFELAESRLILVPLPVFATWLGQQKIVQTARMRNAGDAGARVTTGCFLTHGFALMDVMNWTADRGRGLFEHRRIKSSPSLIRYLQDHHFEIVLTSVPAPEKETRHPVCLFRAGESGGLLVVDVDPMLAGMATAGALTPGATLLMQFLGVQPVQLGQYATLPKNDLELCRILGELVDRYPMLEAWPRTGWSPLPAEAIIRVGHALGFPGRSENRRPLLVVRGGLDARHAETVFGVMHWIKQLMRQEPYICPYREELLGTYRVTWIPRAVEMAGWGDEGGNAVSLDHVVEAQASEPIDLWLDVVGSSTSTIQVSCDQDDRDWRRMSAGLLHLAPSLIPRLKRGDSSVGASAIVASSVDPGIRRALPAPAADRTRRVLRLTVPIPDCPLDQRSIVQNDLVSQLVEIIVGLHLGMIAVNRRNMAVTLSAPRETRITRSSLKPMCAVSSPAPWQLEGAGGELVIPPASAIIHMDRTPVVEGARVGD